MSDRTNIKIRSATEKDLQRLREFEQGVIAAERDFASNLSAGPIQYYDLEGLLSSKSAALMVAEQEDKLVACGYAKLKTDKPYFTPRRYAYLGFMYVLPELRGRGVIQQIIKALTDWANSKGVKAFKLDVYSRNDPAIRAYEKLGFRAEMLTMLKTEQ